MIVNKLAQCLCSEGFSSASDHSGGCLDINECLSHPCPTGAVCTNSPGSYSCQCPGGSSGNPYKGGCLKLDISVGCDENHLCPIGENCVPDAFSESNVCICRQGYNRDQNSGQCVDINECSDNRDKPACGHNALCKNLPGSYECQCPPGFNGNPYTLCEECNSLECQCHPPYQFVGGNCILAGCSKGGKCPTGAECISISGGVSYCACPKGYRTQTDGSCADVDECSEGQQVCGFGAECINSQGGYECMCPVGYGGEPYHGLCAPPQRQCASDKQCNSNEKCVQPGECVCPPPFFLDTSDGNKCKSPCERFPCGINAKCTPSDPPQCMCQVGFRGDPFQGCVSENECANSPCAYGAQCVNEKGGYKCVCPQGQTGDAYKGGCILENGSSKSQCLQNSDCADTLACVRGTCISPCSSLVCGPNAYCEPENHAAWCRCRVGYEKGPDGDCVSRKYRFKFIVAYCIVKLINFQISECSHYQCNTDAICIVTRDGPTCKCPPGLLGNPFPGGSCTTDQCSISRPCSDSQVCIGGRCKYRCDNVVCGIGATCDATNGKCVCEPNFVGNPDLLCMPRKLKLIFSY